MLNEYVKVALVYDRVNKWGGAERVLLTLHELFPDAPLYTSVHHEDKANWAQIFPKIIPSFINRVSYLRDKHEIIPFLMPIVFESFDFSEYDLVISVTSEAAKGIKVTGKTKHLCYCLTPTRYLWHHYDLYFGNNLIGKITSPIVIYLRKWDKMAAQRPDCLVAISREVQKRIKRYYTRNSHLLYPPIDISNFKFKHTPSKPEYYLLVSRLVKYKSVELAVGTFNELGLPLYIVGTGKEERKLKSQAKSNIVFLGSVSHNVLLKTYSKAKALIVPQEEDFGLVMVEAQALGIPVISFAKGGAKDIVIDGKTGVLFNKQTKDALKKAISRFEGLKFNRRDIVNNSKRFSANKFKRNLRKLIESL